MKTVKLQGGLGNQMFQYAIARALETNKSKDVYLDLSFLKENSTSNDFFTARDFELSIFRNLRAKKLNALQEKILLSDRIRYKYLRNVLNLEIVPINQIENEFIDIPLSKNMYLNGFFQSEKYFKSIKEDLIEDFQFPELDVKNRIIRAEILTNNSVSIHIRRGDYISLQNVNTYHGVLDLDYYIKAIKTLQEKMSESLSFYIFSDDPDYAKENFNFSPDIKIIDWNKRTDSWKDMALMQACRHHIIANSSFSWWGAWLSERGGRTLAPAKWFSDNVSFNISDIIPAKWIKFES